MVYLLLQHQEPVKIAFIQAILNDTILFVFGFCMEFGLFCADFTGACQQFIAVELQKTVQPLCPVLHAHGDLALGLQLGIIQIEPDTARSPIGEVSGGQMQRALLARAVISDPKLLILDEPANFVDNKFEKELYRTLHELNARMAIVMVSHDIGTITSVVKEIVCVNRQVHRHRSNILTEEQLRNYDCPIQLVSHGHIPHTVLEHHPGDCCRDHE